GGRSDGVCERNKQTEHPWSACKKAPSVAVTWGWGSHDLLADLGNNARSRGRELRLVALSLPNSEFIGQ
ncbi:MAG: hypothetical protein ACRC5V_12635, partial [Aeromonas sp.]